MEPAEIVGCSGGAIWGSMWAAGMSAQEMAEFSLSWNPEDYLDIQWLKLPRFALSAMRGFTGLAKGEAIEQLFDKRLFGMTCGDTPIPITTIVYNMDLGTLEYFGSTRTPEVTLGHLVRVAIALPLFIESVRVGDHLYVDGGIVENWPAEPAIEDGGFDHVFGVNLMLPAGFQPEGHHRLARPHRRDTRGEPAAPAGLSPRAGAPGQAASWRQADPDRAGRGLRAARDVLLRPVHRSKPLAAADAPGLRGGHQGTGQPARQRRP